jgi:hypothetical protein
MMNPTERTECPRVTLEELLRVKRAERPSPEFWARFEQDLRTKQLAAIVEKRPWWVSLKLPQFARTAARFQMPLGAAAALALSLVVMREYRPFATVEEAVTLVPPSEVREVVSLPAEDPAPSRAMLAVSSMSPEAEPTASLELSAPVPTAVHDVKPEPVGALMALIPWSAPQSAAANSAGRTLVVRDLPQVHFAAAVDPVRDHTFDTRMEVGSVVVSTTQPDASDSGVVMRGAPASLREIRRNRILSSLVVADHSTDAERSRGTLMREVATGSLSDDRIYDGAARVGMGGDRFILKF